MKVSTISAMGIIAAFLQMMPTNIAYADISKAETDLLSEIARDGMFEVKLAQLADQKAAGTDVQKFARHMVTEHAKANDKLKAAAEKDHVTLPTGISVDQKNKEEALWKLSGVVFDKKYMDEMVAAHNKAVIALTKEAETGSGSCKSWAAETLPTIKEHKKEALSINSRIAKQVELSNK